MNNEFMNDDLFADLMESVREGGSILRGEKEAVRTFELDAVDVRHIRERYRLSQTEFAALLGISVKTVQNWEQGRRTPRGAARVLLQVAAKHPEAVWDIVQPAIQAA